MLFGTSQQCHGVDLCDPQAGDFPKICNIFNDLNN